MGDGTVSRPCAVGDRGGVAYSDINYDAPSSRGVYAEVSTKVLRAKWTSAVDDPGGNSVGTLYLWWAGEWCGDGGGGLLGDGERYGECQLAQVVLSSESIILIL